jgi:phosphatidate phosphatase LPIN
MLCFPRPLWEVPATAAVGQEGTHIFSRVKEFTANTPQVEFVVNEAKQPFPMKLGEGGEAFFVFETTGNIPAGLQTSPLASPIASPVSDPTEVTPSIELQEPDPLDLATDTKRGRTRDIEGAKAPPLDRRAQSDSGESRTGCSHAEYMVTNNGR